VITEWVKIGRRKWTAFRAAEKRAEMAKRRQGKPPKLTEKQKEKLEAEVVMNMKLESPDPEVSLSFLPNTLCAACIERVYCQ